MKRRAVLGLVLAALAALAAIAFGAAYLPLSGGRAGVPLERVEARPFARRVQAEGELRSVRATQLSVPVGVPGPFRIGWLAEDGTRVREGDVVIRFDPAEVEKQLVEAADELESARLEARKQRSESLAEVRKLEQDLELARQQLDNARQFQKKDEMVFSRSEIVESEIDQELARGKEEHARGARGRRETLSQAGLDLLGIRMRQAEARIVRARQSLSALAVTAPHDGVLVLKRGWRGETAKVGDQVWNNQVLAEIPDLSSMEAEVFVLEADAGGLAPGRQAAVVLESRPGAEHAARIARVEALAKPRFRGSPVQYFGVVLALDATDPRIMKPGQRVRATLHLDERASALTVPRQAVFEREGKMVVYRQKAGGLEPVAVTLGPGSAGRVVVESGLAPGDVVALADPNRKREPPGQETPQPGSSTPGTPAP